MPAAGLRLVLLLSASIGGSAVSVTIGAAGGARLATDDESVAPGQLAQRGLLRKERNQSNFAGQPSAPSLLEEAQQRRASCTGHFGSTPQTTQVCCGQAGKVQSNGDICPEDEPYCINYKINRQQGVCVSALSATKETVMAKCNSFTCPNGYYKKRFAEELACRGKTCVAANDKLTCCKLLTKVIDKGWCKGAQALNAFRDWSLEECVRWAIDNGVTFFAYGYNGKSTEKLCMSQQMSTGSAHCSGAACCSCAANSGGWKHEACHVASGWWDYYKLA